MGIAINKKMKNVLKKNNGLKYYKIYKKLWMARKPENKIPEELTVSVISVDIERSFSIYNIFYPTKNDHTYSKI